MARGFCYGLAGARVDLFPGLFADHEMNVQALSLIRAKAVLDVVYPLEPLLSISPLHGKSVVLFELLQTVKFLPNAGKRLILKHYHELPLVLAAYRHDWAGGVETVEEKHDPEVREVLLQAGGEAVERFGLTVLLVVARVALAVLQELAHQGDDHAVLKGEIRFEHIDVVLFLAVFLFADLSLQPRLAQVEPPRRTVAGTIEMRRVHEGLQ